MSIRVGTKVLSQYLDVTEGRVIHLARAGILKRAKDKKSGKELRGRYDLQANVNAYIRHIRLRVKEGSDGDEYSIARAQRMKALAQIEVLRLKQLRREVMSRKVVTDTVCMLLGSTKNHMLAIPSRIFRQLKGLTDEREIYKLLEDAIRLGLTELSRFSVEDGIRSYYNPPESPVFTANGEHED